MIEDFYYIDPLHLFNGQFPTEKEIAMKRREMLLEFDINQEDIIYIDYQEYDKNSILEFFEMIYANIQIYDKVNNNDTLKSILTTGEFNSVFDLSILNDDFVLATTIKQALNIKISENVLSKYFHKSNEASELDVFTLNLIFSRMNDKSYFNEAIKISSNAISNNLNNLMREYNKLNFINVIAFCYRFEDDFSDVKRKIIIGLINDEKLIKSYYSVLDRITKLFIDASITGLQALPKATRKKLLSTQEFLYGELPSEERKNVIEKLRIAFQHVPDYEKNESSWSLIFRIAMGIFWISVVIRSCGKL